MEGCIAGDKGLVGVRCTVVWARRRTKGWYKYTALKQIARNPERRTKSVGDSARDRTKAKAGQARREERN